MIDFSTPQAQRALATAAERTKLTPQDIAAWSQVASLDDASAILDGYRLANIPVSKDWFEVVLAAVTIIGQICNAVIPVVGLAGAIKNLIP